MRDKEAVRVQKRAYYAANKEKLRAARLAYCAANKEKIRAAKRAYYAANKEKLHAYMRVYRAANQEKLLAAKRAHYTANKEKLLAAKRAYKANNKDAVRRTQWRRRGISADAAELALITHDGMCDACGTDSPGGNGWCVDHSHTSGRVRGVLCAKCNIGIGMLGDNVEGLRKALAYLEKNDT